MRETYTPTPESQKPTTPQLQEDDFAAINRMQDDAKFKRKQREAAERFLQNTTPVTSEAPAPRSGFSTTEKVIAGVVASAAAFGGGAAAADHLAPAEVVYSTTANVPVGEGIEVAVDDAIGHLRESGADPADATERQDVISQAVALHADENGIVQPNETVKVIVEESAVFGNQTYKAVPSDSEKSE